MKMNFTKMHGCGNDYIYVSGYDYNFDSETKTRLAIELSDRHFGIGSDGLIFINPSPIADFEMEMYNADGSRSEMCGNGIRCVAKYVFDKGMISESKFSIESMGKIKYISVTSENGFAKYVRVDMGEPILEPKNIPVLVGEERCIDETVEIGGEKFSMTCVSMGNPHAVLMHNPDNVLKYGPIVETDSRFPNRVNAEFVEILDRRNVRMRVWERGTGETLCCGTGCCATTVACILNGFTEDEITIHVLGGQLQVFWNREDNHVYMTGPAESVFEGSVEIGDYNG